MFRVSGSSTAEVKSAVAIMEEAIGVYKSLTEGDFQGQFVEPEVSIQGIMFSYAPPPKDKMPKAACVKQLSQSLATRKGTESPNHHLSHFINRHINRRSSRFSRGWIGGRVSTATRAKLLCIVSVSTIAGTRTTGIAITGIISNTSIPNIP